MTTDTTLPIIDWQYQERLNQTSPGLIEEMVDLFGQELPELQAAINQSFVSNNLLELEDQLHKLRGGCTYCGFPRLKSAITNLEKACKNNRAADPKLVAIVNYEIATVFSILQEKGIIKS